MGTLVMTDSFMSLTNFSPAIGHRFRRSLFWLSLSVLSVLSGGARAQETLPIPAQLKESIQSVTCLPPSAIKTANLATTKRLVVAGPGEPNIRPRLLAVDLGDECIQGDYAAFTVEVAIYPDAGSYEKVGSEYVPVMCSITGGYHPGCSIGIKGQPAPNSYYRTFAKPAPAVRASQLPRGNGRIFAGRGETVSVDNITTFASYDEGPRFASGTFYVWEVCRDHRTIPTSMFPYNGVLTTKCELVDETDPLPFGITGVPGVCLLKDGNALVSGYCNDRKEERLATAEEKKQHIKGVLDAQCRGREDDHMNLCSVVHTDRFIVWAAVGVFPVAPYGSGSLWGYDNLRGNRIYPFSGRVARASNAIFSPGAVRVEDESSPGLPKLNTYEYSNRPKPKGLQANSSSPTSGSTANPPLLNPNGGIPPAGSGSYTSPTPTPSGPSGGSGMPTQGDSPSSLVSGSSTPPTPPPSGPSGGSRMPTQGGSPSTPVSGSYTAPGSPNGPQCAGGICR